MNLFTLLSLFGGLAMFLYGMRLMGDSLKESSSGTLKKAMEQVTNNPVRAFVLGIAVTALIQSSTATIVITSGLVGAGILSLHQSLPIVIGANVGTTVTGQIIRLLDLDSSAVGFLELFKPSTLAPIALIAGIILLMGMKFRNSKTLGNILIGFGILFSGLLNMTAAVNVLSETGIFERLFSQLGTNPLLGYATGAGTACLLQSSSATIGILQALSSSGQLAFNQVYAVIVGVYLGDCVTTAIVCWIGARAEQKRVGVVNILYNLSKSALTLLGIFIFRMLGLLDGIWTAPVNPGSIANANTIFNLACAVILLPVISFYEQQSFRIVKDDPVPRSKYEDKLEELNPVFFSTPALALNSCYDILMTMFTCSRDNLNKAVGLITEYDGAVYGEVCDEEENINLMADRTEGYLALLSGSLKADLHIQILNHYYKIVIEFERIGDHAQNIANIAKDMHMRNVVFSDAANEEIALLVRLIDEILDRTDLAFRKRDEEAAAYVEPMEEVMDDLVDLMKEHHLVRLTRGECSVYAGSDYMNLLNEIETISDVCSDIALATLTRVHPELARESHDYIHLLHEGGNEDYNRRYQDIRKAYFEQLNKLIPLNEQNL